MNALATGELDLEQLRQRLHMNDAELLRFGQAAKYMCSPEANLGHPPRESFVIQLREAREEWKRRNLYPLQTGGDMANRRAVMFCVFFACGYGPALLAQNQTWGNWKSDTKFPGIQIRARCQYYNAGDNVSDWNYQLRNNYSIRVYVTYRDENRESSPEHPVLGGDRMHLLAPDEESPVFDDYATRTCGRGGIRIAVTNVEPSASGDKILSSNEVLAVTKQEITAFYEAHRSQFGQRSLSDASVQRTIREQLQKQKSKVGAGTTTNSQASVSTAPPVQSATAGGFRGDVSGTTWSCDEERDRLNLNGTFDRHLSLHYLLTFNRSGSMSTKAMDDYAPYVSRWKQDGNALKWLDFGEFLSGGAHSEYTQIVYDVQISGT